MTECKGCHGGDNENDAKALFRRSVVRASWKNLMFTGSRSWPWRGAQPTQGGEAVVGALGLRVQRSTRLGAASRLLHQETERRRGSRASRGVALVIVVRHAEAG
ncbi:hypothetical protein TRIUR3_33114 [Triticum urartu]|uniref:Uncharacterized protein n=1 Tax=Triticum urartu TaxID=4572 RepID=M7YEH5_TRIUA|nr:hypothetical protein TRIUR3_33114 [Triticum urartu]